MLHELGACVQKVKEICLLTVWEQIVSKRMNEIQTRCPKVSEVSSGVDTGMPEALWNLESIQTIVCCRIVK
eukprot:694967-Prymnesium_polylepis.1